MIFYTKPHKPFDLDKIFYIDNNTTLFLLINKTITLTLREREREREERGRKTVTKHAI